MIISQKGFVHVLVILTLLIGVGVGFHPKASVALAAADTSYNFKVDKIEDAGVGKVNIFFSWDKISNVNRVTFEFKLFGGGWIGWATFNDPEKKSYKFEIGKSIFSYDSEYRIVACLSTGQCYPSNSVKLPADPDNLLHQVTFLGSDIPLNGQSKKLRLVTAGDYRPRDLNPGENITSNVLIYFPRLTRTAQLKLIYDPPSKETLLTGGIYCSRHDNYDHIDMGLTYNVMHEQGAMGLRATLTDKFTGDKITLKENTGSSVRHEFLFHDQALSEENSDKFKLVNDTREYAFEIWRLEKDPSTGNKKLGRKITEKVIYLDKPCKSITPSPVPSSSPSPTASASPFNLVVDKIEDVPPHGRIIHLKWDQLSEEGATVLLYKTGSDKDGEFQVSRMDNRGSGAYYASNGNSHILKIRICDIVLCDDSKEIVIPAKETVAEVSPTPTPIPVGQPDIPSQKVINTPVIVQKVLIGHRARDILPVGELEVELSEEAAVLAGPYRGDYDLALNEVIGDSPNYGGSSHLRIVKFKYKPAFQYFVNSDGTKLHYRKCAISPTSPAGVVQPCGEWGESAAPNGPIRSYHVLGLGNGQAVQYTVSEDGMILNYRKCTVDPNSAAGVVQPCNEEGWKSSAAPHAPIRSYAVLNLGNGKGTQVVINDSGDKLFYRKCTLDPESPAGVVQPCDEWQESGNPQGKNNSYTILNLGNGKVVQLYISFDLKKLHYRGCTLDPDSASGITHPCSEWLESGLPQGTNRSYGALSGY